MRQIRLIVSEKLAEELKCYRNEIYQILKLGLRQLKKDKLENGEGDDFLSSPLGRYILSFANPNVTLEQLQQELSAIKGTLTADVIAEREA